MGFRLEDAADTAAHKVENDLKNPSPEQAAQNLRAELQTMSAASPRMQNEFLGDLMQDDPTALKKIQALLPDFKLEDQQGNVTMRLNTDKLSTTDRAGTWAASSIAEEGGFGANNDRNYVKSATLESNPADVVKAINSDLASVGDTKHTVAIEKAANPSDPSEIVLRNSGHKTDAIMLPEKAQATATN